MIIKLTEVRNSTVRDGAKKPELHDIYVNVNQIQSFAKSINGSDTRLQLQGTGYLFVKESCEEILNMIVPKMTETEAYAKLEAILPGNLMNYGVR